MPDELYKAVVITSGVCVIVLSILLVICCIAAVMDNLKRKQIEEMTNIMFEYAVDGLLPEIKNHMEEVSTKQAIKKVLWEYAKALYEAGCRKISKNAVVLTKERDGYLDDRFAVCHKLRQAIAENAELQKQVDELKKRLHIIFALGFDYDGCDGVKGLKGLIDELVKITQMDSKEFAEYYNGVEVE